MNKNIYSQDELYSQESQRTFKNDAKEAAFLLGGIGTGNVSIGARGEFRDWEIFNTPGKGNKLDYTFFSIFAKEKNKKPISKVLESCLQSPFSSGFGLSSGDSAGLPRFKNSTMKGEYPFLSIDFQDDEVPVKVSMEAFTPFIPLNPEASGIPCAVLRYKVKNTSSEYVDVTIAGSIQNAVGISGVDKFGWEEGHDFSKNINEFKEEEDLSGLYMYSSSYKDNYIRYGNMSLMTPEKDVTYKANWLAGAWFDAPQDFWDDFSSDGLLDVISSCDSVGSFIAPSINTAKIGSLGIPCRLKSGEEKKFTFVLSWYFPNRFKGWNFSQDSKANIPVVKNHYTKQFGSAWEVGEYVIKNLTSLEKDSRKFHSALFGSTLPNHVIDAAACNITVLRSPTCIWLEDGTMTAWEGCSDKGGCCEGTCTHVWNYAQTTAFLFPTLEQSARTVEFTKETDEEGNMAFRTRSVFELSRFDFHPAADGQMGSIIRLYREWKISGDNEFLKASWEGAKRALDFAFTYWDKDGDCVLDSQQHNTYDIEFYGLNSLTNSMFFGALKAGIELAKAMGDLTSAEKYKKALESGSKKMDDLLWNGEYYIQKIDDINKYKYQYGTGCLSDQLLGQFMAHVTGLGYILPEEHVKSAVKAIFNHNFLPDFSNHVNVQRTYVLNDEKGLLLCSWPHGGRPRFPFVYSDEVWTGIEYQVASNLIFEGFIDEGLTIVKSVRERHDGYKRNPWNEVECGHHYARSMASWAVIIALSGFKCDMVKKELHFSPKINKGDFSTFWSTGTGWGVYWQKINAGTRKLEYGVDVLYGNIDGVKIVVNKKDLE
ncbi:MAG TPA: GH116 family glycosyl-hydrolase [Clostridiaceae bacterium]